ncbi:MAG: hypothetical protein AAFY59_08235 [Pseudomonadota bacterium]
MSLWFGITLFAVMGGLMGGYVLAAMMTVDKVEKQMRENMKS